MKVRYEIGHDMKIYAVFHDNLECEIHGYAFLGCPITSFGGYENSYLVCDLWGM